ncbi:hypothetical protein [Leifsonia poae]|uniref:hypothetical protein n=1 Tax=Leifsonia poae TaxID=110933 RepID=UPI003D66CF11
MTVVAAAVAVATTLTACSEVSASNSMTAAHSARPSTDEPVPNFTGPYAARFAEAYRKTTSDLAHRILSKESITDQDYAAISGIYVKCMTNKGFKVHIDGPTGEMTISDVPTDADVDAANAADATCNADFAEISSLRGALLMNPQNLDMNEIVVACLIKKKVAPPSYTASKYAHDLETMTFPFDENSGDSVSASAIRSASRRHIDASRATGNPRIRCRERGVHPGRWYSAGCSPGACACPRRTCPRGDCEDGSRYENGHRGWAERQSRRDDVDGARPHLERLRRHHRDHLCSRRRGNVWDFQLLGER